MALNVTNVGVNNNSVIYGSKECETEQVKERVNESSDSSKKV